MKKTILSLCAATLIASGFFSGNVYAEEEKPTGDVTVGVFSQYIWRGQELSQDSIVIQPSMTIGYKGFSVNLWGNLDSEYFADESSNWNETDLTLQYSKTIGNFGLSAGYIYYSLDGLDDSQEVFMGVSYNTLITPTLKIYREFAHYPSWYLTASVSHAFTLNEQATLNLGGQISYLLSDDDSAYPQADYNCKEYGVCDDEFSNFHDGMISATLPYKFSKYFTLTPQLYWVFPLSSDASDEMEWRSVDDDKDNFVYGGLSLSFTF